MDRKSLQHFKRELETELEEVDTKLEQGFPKGENTTCSHMAEAATAAEQRMLVSAIRGLLKTKREQVLLALRRIKDGTYGICALCGRDISQERLELVPHTPFCISCASNS